MDIPISNTPKTINPQNVPFDTCPLRSPAVRLRQNGAGEALDSGTSPASQGRTDAEGLA